MKVTTMTKANKCIKSLTLTLCSIVLACIPLAAVAADTSSGTHEYSAHGVVEKIAPDHQEVTIRHQAIPGYMMAMTMDFPVQNTNELNGITPGDKIDFTLVVNETNSWVENFKRTGHTNVTANTAMDMKMEHKLGKFERLKPGDMFPDGEMISESGKKIHLSDFHGKAVAFTFFFTRCPLPNYCPLMNRNFAATRDLLETNSAAPANWELLSISFDTGYDTPQTLSNFATVYRGESSSHWLFTTATTNALADWAPHIGLMVMRQGDNISHNLRTIVIDPQGRLFKQFNGNTWTAKELADAITEAAKK